MVLVPQRLTVCSGAALTWQIQVSVGVGVGITVHSPMQANRRGCLMQGHAVTFSFYV